MVRRGIGWLAVGAQILLASPALAQEASAVTLPPGVKAVWDLTKAYRESTPTRERVCINGLWKWQPAAATAAAVPVNNWGYFKVPGCWPGITDYMQKDCQTVFPHPAWKNENLANITAAWYQRKITIPANWAGRDIALSAAYLNSYAVVYVDGQMAGEMRFPDGEVDLTGLCHPGAMQTLSILVVALPLKGVTLSYTDTNSAQQVKGSVARRGLCGDVYLYGRPRGARIDDVKVDTSMRHWQITFTEALSGLSAGSRYSLRARVTEDGKPVREFASKPFPGADVRDGRFSFTASWKPAKLWDTDTPQNKYGVSVSLLNSGGAVVDTSFSKRFGFREFWIVGRDFYLNGTRIFLSAVPLDNTAVGAAWATYDGVRQTLKRLKSIGINCVYTDNYSCKPGEHLSFDEALRAADDSGVLVAFSQPHFSDYEWTAPDADLKNGYARDAAFYVRAAEDHPSVVMYAMSHNATGYSEDTDPDVIDGLHGDPTGWATKNEKLALRAEAIVKHLDPSRIVYHHSSGNLGAMYTLNFYTNFAPRQELDSWFEHWATQGVKPVFLVEYGSPYSWDWTMYRGWYNGQREFGSARVPWEYCIAEWDSQFIGDRAFNTTPMEKTNIRWEAEQFRAGALWFRWDYPYAPGTPVFDDQQQVMADYITDNWRAYRTWGVSGISPSEYGLFWKTRNGVDRSRKELPVDWDNLQRPGYSADYIDQRYERMDMAFEPSDWIPTAAGKAVARNNMPVLSYIAGKPGNFTSKDHNFLPGQTVEKQIIVINDSRKTVTCECRWSFGLPRPVSGSHPLRVQPGQQARLPLKFVLPTTLAPGRYELNATFRISDGSIQQDSFTIEVLPPAPRAPQAETSAPLNRALRKVALFDPKGETAALLTRLHVPFQNVDAAADLSPYKTLVIGMDALSPTGPGPDLSRVRDGLKVILFEQTSDVLEKRLGFRVEEYGLRQVFPRVPGHPVLNGLSADNLRDWEGSSTLIPHQIPFTLNLKFDTAPTVEWCGMQIPRVWRCGTEGNVASVLIEKPARGDFLPLIDGGYSEQYSPLMEYHEGKGMILFCQMDVTGRTDGPPTPNNGGEDGPATRPAIGEGVDPTPALPAIGEGENLPPLAGGLRGVDPAATRLAENILRYVSDWKPAPERQAVYVGDAAGETYIRSTGLSVQPYDSERLTAGQVLIVGPGGGPKLAASAPAIAAWIKTGGHVLAIGLDQSEANECLPEPVTMKNQEHISSYFEAPPAGSPFTGVSPADLQDRDPRVIPLVTSGATVLGDGVLARVNGSNVVFCQLAPWQFSSVGPENQKRTFRRTAVLLARLIANMGVAGSTPLLSRFSSPAGTEEKRWLDGLYLDATIDWDDPYRFFGW